MKHYSKFGAMVLTATIVMYCLTYLNVYALPHVQLSEMRVYMAVVMGSAMTIIMLAFMWKMYTNRWANYAIIAGSAIVFSIALWLARSQTTVDDVSYMRAMIPHHSIAILTSERANITDPRVRKLADEIIEAQRKEIAEMDAYIRDLTSPSDRE